MQRGNRPTVCGSNRDEKLRKAADPRRSLTLGVCLRLGENDPTSAAAEPAGVLAAARPPFIPAVRHSQSSALAPIPALGHIRMLPGTGGGSGWVGVFAGAEGFWWGWLSLMGVQSDAVRPQRAERALHVWACRSDLPSSPADPPRRPYKEPPRAAGGFLWEMPVAAKQGYRFAASWPHPALKWERRFPHVNRFRPQSAEPGRSG
ncbi:uncharacterized protein LOC129364452 [Poeciliopsis prolifica]|uniref:uncharacterized protein LOC129364452 n=1 Tax=Poeciliopsis prolifica TaxID=188132 RepID=UPI00241361D7|nr:uncharacterized protein LOC129364452 [Poeciliopsis prolifica]